MWEGISSVKLICKFVWSVFTWCSMMSREIPSKMNNHYLFHCKSNRESWQYFDNFMAPLLMKPQEKWPFCFKLCRSTWLRIRDVFGVTRVCSEREWSVDFTISFHIPYHHPTVPVIYYCQSTTQYERWVLLLMKLWLSLWSEAFTAMLIYKITLELNVIIVFLDIVLHCKIL